MERTVRCHIFSITLQVRTAVLCLMPSSQRCGYQAGVEGSLFLWPGSCSCQSESCETFLSWADGKAHLLCWQFAGKWMPCVANPSTAGNQERTKIILKKMHGLQKNESHSYLEIAPDLVSQFWQSLTQEVKETAKHCY